MIVPLHNEAATLETLWERVAESLEQDDRSFELIFVDDGSADDSSRVIQKLMENDSRIRAYRLPRQHGKAAALAVGFSAAAGRCVVTIDADLQDDPFEIPSLLAELDGSFDVVSGWKRERQDRAGRRYASRVFNFMTRRVSGIGLHDFNCGLKAYTQDCARVLAHSCYGDMHRFLPVIAHYYGFHVTEIPVQHYPRAFGQSRYGLERYPRGLLDLLTTVFLCRYARRPMHVFGGAGILMFTAGFLALATLTVEKLAMGASIGGRPLLILGVLLVITGIQFVLTGLIAEMVTRLPGGADAQRVVGIVPVAPMARTGSGHPIFAVVDE